mmetsp:Transcript_37067/g.106075  ORF Transcript_37067/g.106075 Transcript_37067/m.106075 type:complete len:461 (+) Transcript_37067:561-1943(+)
MDPPRPEVPQAIEECRNAGIKVVMITGDNPKTAEAIARQTNILDKEPEPTHATKHTHDATQDAAHAEALTGRQFESLTEHQQIQLLSRLSDEHHPADENATSFGLVFSRTEPRHKQQIVKILKRLDCVVAMTGDGVNDAPALKEADIGVAMGVTGTEVAKESSDMVLAEETFSTIVAAVEEGRAIYNNMRGFIRYLISSNFGEVASIFLTAIIGLPGFLAPVQLLWVNLVTDGLPATALSFNPADGSVMSQPPRKSSDPLVTRSVFIRYLIVGTYVGLATVGVFMWWYLFDKGGGHPTVTLEQLREWSECARFGQPLSFDPAQYGLDVPCDIFTTGKVEAATLSLTTLVMLQMFNAFNALSEEESLLRKPPWSNPYLVAAVATSIAIHCGILYTPVLADVFGVSPLSLRNWGVVMAVSAPVVAIDEAIKLVYRTQQNSANLKDITRETDRADGTRENVRM